MRCFGLRNSRSGAGFFASARSRNSGKGRECGLTCTGRRLPRLFMRIRPTIPRCSPGSRSCGPGTCLSMSGKHRQLCDMAGELGAEVIALEPAADTFALLMENLALNEYQIAGIQAAAGAACGTARFTSGRDSVNRFDPGGPVEARVVTIDSIVGDRIVAGMKVDVEGFEIDVLRGSERALSEHRLKLIQLEWNATSLSGVGADRRPVADLLARHGYCLYRPARDGTLVP